MYTIGKRFRFSAAHFLPLGENHPCSRVHGHNYEVEISLKSKCLDESGFVVDFLELRSFKDYLDKNFDHALINDKVVIPTCENLAFHFFNYAKTLFGDKLHSVTVYESEGAWAKYEDS